MTKSRVFLWLLLFFILGVGFSSFFKIPSFLFRLIAGLGALLIGIGWFGKNKTAILAGFLFLTLALGVSRFSQVAGKQPDLSLFFDRYLRIEGTVYGEPEIKASQSRLKIRVESVENFSLARPFKIQVFSGKYPEYGLGDKLILEGKLEKPGQDEDFDYASFLARQDIFAVCFFPRIERMGEGDIGAIKKGLTKIKKAFVEKIELVLAEPHAAFLKGLLLGEKQSLPADLTEAFKQTGTTHIIALSGYNITLVSRFVLGFLTFLTIPFLVSFWLAVLGIILFVIMTGASASVVRAAIMGILILLARREGRVYGVTNALVLAGALMVWQNPRILVFDAGFQLSFLATLGLIYLAPQLEKTFRFQRALENKKESSLKKILIETLSAQLAVLPLLIYLFGRVSLISPLTNLLVLLAVPYSMFLGFLTGLAGFLSAQLSFVLGWLTWLILEYEIRVIEFFAGFPLASIELGRLALGFTIVFYAFVIWKFAKKWI